MQRARTVDDKHILVGGIPPLAPGFLTSRGQRRLFAAFSSIVNGYWVLARRWIA